MNTIAITITNLTCGKPLVSYHCYEGDKPPIHTSMDYDEARILMWKLLKRGGRKYVEVHPYRPSIVTRRVILVE